jgi:hypothetical protein
MRQARHGGISVVLLRKRPLPVLPLGMEPECCERMDAQERLMHMDVRMPRAQEAQERPLARGEGRYWSHWHS